VTTHTHWWVRAVLHRALASPGLIRPSPLAEAGARNPEYAQALHSFILSGGKAHGAELLAGADGNGGYVLPGSGAYTRQRGANGSFLKTVAATYEGSLGSSNGAGGYAISVPTSDLIVPLALPDPWHLRRGPGYPNLQ
jgi:hypothetical protein